MAMVEWMIEGRSFDNCDHVGSSQFKIPPTGRGFHRFEVYTIEDGRSGAPRFDDLRPVSIYPWRDPIFQDEDKPPSINNSHALPAATPNAGCVLHG